MDRNKLFYKQRPYIYGFLGVIAFAYAKQSKLAFISGVVLLLCSFVVFEMRRRYRENQDKIKISNKIKSTKANNSNDTITVVDRK